MTQPRSAGRRVRRQRTSAVLALGACDVIMFIIIIIIIIMIIIIISIIIIIIIMIIISSSSSSIIIIISSSSSSMIIVISSSSSSSRRSSSRSIFWSRILQGDVPRHLDVPWRRPQDVFHDPGISLHTKMLKNPRLNPKQRYFNKINYLRFRIPNKGVACRKTPRRCASAILRIILANPSPNHHQQGPGILTTYAQSPH